jgi:predicted transcriptional regulator
MSLQISLPLGNKEGVKNLVFTLLTKEYPLKLIELTNFIRKRYGKAVTFQAVRKAVLELVEEGVLIKEETAFSINKDWIVQAKKTLDGLYEQVHQQKNKPMSFDAIGEEISVFTFDSLAILRRLC